MKLSDKAKKAIKTQAINKLALALNCSVYSVVRWIKENENNNDLTKSIAVQIISEETEIPIDEILEDSDVKEMQGITTEK